MSRYYLFFLFLPLFIPESSFSKDIIDCRVVIDDATECNPYGSKLIMAREVGHTINTKKLIISKTLPLPQKVTVRVISVADMIEKYVKVEDSLRYKGTQKASLKIRVTQKIVPKEIVKQKLQEMKTFEDKAIKEQKEETPRITETHPLPIVKEKEENGKYTVETGDVLGKIANKFEVTKKELRKLNDLAKGAILKVGQELKIPLPQKIVDSIANAEYSIEPGDTLLSIAYKFNIEPKVLVSFNHIKSNTTIQIGKKLSLPLPYVMKRIEAEKKKLALKKEAERKIKKRKLVISKKVKMIRGFGTRQLRVTATAYTSHKRQTDKTPFLAAWNNRIRPGMKIIAVSRDLLTRYGLKNGSRVHIGGLQGYYRVRDKMNKRYKKRIDIYMGVNRRRALHWGRRSVMLYW